MSDIPRITMTSSDGWEASFLCEILKGLPNGTIVHAGGLLKQKLTFNLPQTHIVKVKIEEKS